MRALLEKELARRARTARLPRCGRGRSSGTRPAIDFLIEQGFSAELGARPLKRAVERYLLASDRDRDRLAQFPEGDQFLFITARDGTGSR